MEIIEVGPRDGLQNYPQILAPAERAELIGRLADAGLRRIEVVSFVNPARVPQMADAEAVVAMLPDRPDVSWIGLCLNRRGVERAIATRESGRHGVDEAGCVVSATSAFSERNQGMDRKAAIAETVAMLKLAAAAGLFPQVSISVAFGCPFSGRVEPQLVAGLASELAAAGAQEIALADTIGVAVPAMVTELVGRVREAVPDIALRCHFHNSRGLGAANAWAAWQSGVTRLDSSIGGLGGCPFAPRATGNVATEELAYLFAHSGVESGLELSRLIDVNDWLAGVLGQPLPSLAARAGDFPTQLSSG